MGVDGPARRAVENSGLDGAAVLHTEQPWLRRLAVRIVGEASPDGVVQETFLRAYRARVSFAAGKEVRPWLATIARRVAIDVPRHELVEETATLPVHSHEEESVEDAVADRIRRKGIGRAFSGLSERQRRLLLDAELGIGEAVSDGASRTAVNSVVARARHNFRELFQAIARENGIFAGSAVSKAGASRGRGAGVKVERLAARLDLGGVALSGVLFVGTLQMFGGAPTRPSVRRGVMA